MENQLGVVKWFNEGKGFGFIVCDGMDYFVHFKSIQATGFKNLIEKQRVSFAGRQGPKGLAAEDVTVLES